MENSQVDIPGVTVTFYNARPESLAYHIHVLHVMNIKVKILHKNSCLEHILQHNQCSCNQIKFGTIDEILSVSSNQQVSPDEVTSAQVQEVIKSILLPFLIFLNQGY